MNILIRADRKIGNEFIAGHLFKGQRIIDRIISFFSSMGQNKIYVVSDKSLNVKNVETIPFSKVSSLKNIFVIDLELIYDGRKLKRLIKKGKSSKEAIIMENKTIGNLDIFGCLYERKEWNPISQFYVEPFGEKLAFWLRKTRVSPNFITFLNIILSVLASGLLFLGGPLNLILFAIWTRIYYTLDIVDGQLARFKSKTSKFGAWIDGGGDRLISGTWHIAIASSLYLSSRNVFFLFAGLMILLGKSLYNYLLYTSIAYFRNNRFDYKSSSPIKRNPLVRFILLFINYDIHHHILFICVLVNKLEWFLIFYTIYFNFMWLIFFLFYFLKYVREGDVVEV